jgi:macrolide-specific efflux system membrane fusion protein
MTQMSAQVFFVAAAAKDTIVVPVAALRPLPRGAGANRYAVRVVKDDGAVEERQLTIGVTNRVSAQVVDGLQAGEKVVIGTRAPSAAPAASRPGTGGGPRMGPRLS